MADTDSLHEEKRLAALRAYDILDTPPEESFDRITRVAMSALQMPVVMVSLIDEDRQWFKSRQGVEATEMPRELSFCTHAIEQDEPFIIRDALKDKRFLDNPVVAGDANVRFYVGIPLKTPDGYNIGTLCAVDTKPRDLSGTELNLLRDLAKLVVDELELRQIATTDSLTGAHTRRSFLVEAKRAMDRARRHKGTASFIALDVDHFKSVNDTHGHASGDTVLQNLAAICKSCLRTIDLFGRLGGEEFMIVLPETDRPGAMEVAERLRKTIADTPISDGNKKIAVTASFGVSTFSGGDESPKELIKRADEALYAAKKAGRNRIIFDEPNNDLSEVA